MRKKRKPKELSLQQSIYIFCEGETEENYFRMLKQKYHRTEISIARPKIEIKAMGRSGKMLIHEAIAHTKGKDPGKIYVVFDRDDHGLQEISEFRKLAQKNNIEILFSSICFEIWILMHFEPVFKSYSRPALFQKLSGPQYFAQNYKDFKGADVLHMRKFLYDRIKTAKENADALYLRKNNLLTDDPFTNINCYLGEIFHTDQF